MSVYYRPLHTLEVARGKHRKHITVAEAIRQKKTLRQGELKCWFEK